MGTEIGPGAEGAVEQRPSCGTRSAQGMATRDNDPEEAGGSVPVSMAGRVTKQRGGGTTSPPRARDGERVAGCGGKVRFIGIRSAVSSDL